MAFQHILITGPKNVLLLQDNRNVVFLVSLAFQNNILISHFTILNVPKESIFKIF
jgi:hypothetical protein